MYFLENNISQTVFCLKKDKGRGREVSEPPKGDRIKGKAQRRGFSVAGMSVDHPGSRYVHAEIFIMRIKQRSTLCIEYLPFCQE